MKAIILAGGLGTRLRSVTGEYPKPMAPLLGRPLMEHLVQLLDENGFDEICCTLRYRAGEIMAHFGDGAAFGVSLRYRIETRPLGTAGSVGGCRDFIGGDDVLVVSGDAACDFELRRLMDEHRARGAAASVALSSSADPRRYGLAVTDGEGWIRAFIEKPAWPRVVTDLVNTGLYVLSPRAVAAIPAEGPFDFGRELFPLLLRRGEALAGVRLSGYWSDVGTPLAYYRCCADALEGRLRLTPGAAFRAPEAPEEPEPEEAGFCVACPCEDRARLMGALSELMLELDASFDDGIRVEGRGYRLHIRPSARRSAVRVAVQSEDTEFARALCLSAARVAEALEQGPGTIDKNDAKTLVTLPSLIPTEFIVD